jgi:hypothetical protein
LNSFFRYNELFALRASFVHTRTRFLSSLPAVYSVVQVAIFIVNIFGLSGAFMNGSTWVDTMATNDPAYICPISISFLVMLATQLISSCWLFPVSGGTGESVIVGSFFPEVFPRN